MKKNQNPVSLSEIITFLPMKKEVLVAAGKTVLDLAIGNKIDMAHSCGGNGTCGTCLVICSSDHILPLRNEVEAEMATERGFLPHERLACQLIAESGMQVSVESQKDLI